MRVVRLAACFLSCAVLSNCAPAPQPSELVPASAIIGDTIPAPLSNRAGDRANGQTIFSSRNSGHCVLCHQVEGLAVDFQGNLGPDLTYVADRLSPAQIRLRIVDYERVRPGTVMPSYYRTHALNQLGQDYRGTPILSAQDIEDLVAYLGGL